LFEKESVGRGFYYGVGMMSERFMDCYYFIDILMGPAGGGGRSRVCRKLFILFCGIDLII